MQQPTPAELLNNLGPLYQGLESALKKQYDKYTDILTSLRNFYFLVADSTEERKEEETPNPETEVIEVDDGQSEPLEDIIPISWKSLVPPSSTQFPPDFFLEVVDQLLAWDRLPGQLGAWSDAELVFQFLQDPQRKIPVRIDAQHRHFKPSAAYFERPTFAKLLRVFSCVFDGVCSIFGLDIRRDSVSVTGFRTQVKGMYLSVPTGVSDPGRAQLLEFVSKREIRHSRDLARPC